MRGLAQQKSANVRSIALNTDITSVFDIFPSILEHITQGQTYDTTFVHTSDQGNFSTALFWCGEGASPEATTTNQVRHYSWPTYTSSDWMLRGYGWQPETLRLSCVFSEEPLEKGVLWSIKSVKMRRLFFSHDARQSRQCRLQIFHRHFCGPHRSTFLAEVVVDDKEVTRW